MHQQQQRNPSLSSGVPASVTGLQQQVQVQQLPGSTAAMASPPHPTGNLSASARQPQPQNGKIACNNRRHFSISFASRNQYGFSFD